MRGLVHPDQNVLNATQNSLCRAVNRRRGCCACRASNCRRRARFSRTRSSRERKVLTNQPRKCRSDAIIAGSISEKSESSFSPSHSFCRCTTFWRSTSQRSQKAELVVSLNFDDLHSGLRDIPKARVSNFSICGLDSGTGLSYFIARPCGRAGPLWNAVLKSTWNRGSRVRELSRTWATWILWSPSACTLPNESSFRK